MSGEIFLVRDDGRLVGMGERAYDSEDLLQSLLENYPKLLAGHQVDSANPRRWLLVSREAGVPGEERGGARWSVDHLFLDQDGVPTLVEVKRGSDTRIRREVVGQMLDYAANAVVYWPVESIRAQFEAKRENPDEDLLECLGDGADIEEFWERVKNNLQAGRVRLLFVADVIPQELRRIVEFLNQQMDPAEVLAVEIRQFVGEGLRTLVPRVIGQTAEAERRKGRGRGGGGHWDEATFFEALAQNAAAEEIEVARRILDWARRKIGEPWWGRGVTMGSFVPIYDRGKTHFQLCAVWTSGAVEIYFQYYAKKEAFTSEEKRLELLRRLNAIEGVQIPESAISKRPSIRLSVFTDTARLQGLLRCLEWLVAQMAGD